MLTIFKFFVFLFIFLFFYFYLFIFFFCYFQLTGNRRCLFINIYLRDPSSLKSAPSQDSHKILPDEEAVFHLSVDIFRNQAQYGSEGHVLFLVI